MTLLDGLQILVIDDNADNCALITFMLSLDGATVKTAASVAIAQDSFLASQPQLVICDLAMPVATGYDFLDWLRSLSPADGGQVPVLALTAMARQSDCQEALQAGFNAYLSKPCEPDQLLAVVTQLYQTAQTAGQTALAK
jgi:hypothetical protein